MESTSESVGSALLATSNLKERSITRPGIRVAPSKAWAEARQEASADLKAIRWSRAGLWSLFVVWVYGIIASLLVLALFSAAFQSRTGCQPDSSFNPNMDDYNQWASSTFFQISLGLGNFTFTEVKVIDISWDIIIGRGGQAVMAMIAWRVFADYVTTSMEVTPVTYATFFVIFLNESPSILSTIRLVRDFIFSRSLKSKVAMAFMILNMIFILGWPTFAGAMTGYTSINSAYIMDSSNNYVPFSEFTPLAYIIHDGWRVNLTTDFPVTLDDSPGVSLVWSTYHPFNAYASCCTMVYNVSEYVRTNGFYGLKDTPSIWGSEIIPPPTLDIEAFYVGDYSSLYGFDWADPRTENTSYPFRDTSKIAYTYSNDTYFLNDLRSGGRCQPIPDRYQWGFSFIQLFIMTALLFIWTIGTYIMWLKARFQLPLEGQPEVPRRWKSILVLAEAINQELVENSIHIQSMTDRQIEREIYKKLKGGTLSFDIPLRRSGYSFRRGLWRWLKREKWWCVAWFCSSLSVLSVPLVVLWPFWFVIPSVPYWFCFSTLFAISVGTTKKSRFLLLAASNPVSWLFITPAWIICNIRDRKQQNGKTR
ncbi:hypothetical protein F4810DRAFT_658176 [Camillea tinctor]|nr:hypothetical protein F4810DRAFT_658176 [Camillea tinctor]